MSDRIPAEKLDELEALHKRATPQNIDKAALKESGTSLTVPQVVAYDDAAPAFLVIEFLPEGRRRADFDEALGQGLAAVHRATTSRFRSATFPSPGRQSARASALVCRGTNPSSRAALSPEIVQL